MVIGHDGQLHPSNLQHFFVSSEQQFEASKLGMWLFLATEILLFGGMFVAYGIFRVQYPELYEAALAARHGPRRDQHGGPPAVVAHDGWAIRGAQMDNRKVLIGNLLATIALASRLPGRQVLRVQPQIHEGIYPGVNFELRDDTQTVSDLNGATALSPSLRWVATRTRHTTSSRSSRTPGP